MAKIAPAVTLSDPDRAQLQQWVRAHFTPQQVALRSRILLLAAGGKENLEIAAELKVNRHTPALWRQRYLDEGVDAVWEIQSGRGRKPHYNRLLDVGGASGTWTIAFLHANRSGSATIFDLPPVLCWQTSD